MRRRQFLKSSAGLAAALSLPALASRNLFAATLPSNLADLGAVELSEAIAGKYVSCVEVMQAYLQQIHRYNPVYNAIVGLVEE